MPAAGEQCEFCGERLTGLAAGRGRSGRPARYCSDACRQRAYRRRTNAQRAAPAADAARSADPTRSGDESPAGVQTQVIVPARSWLPAPLDSFVGRDGELSELVALLDRVRLVTLFGPGGAGKTRLAVELAFRLRDRYPYGVWLVELASVTDPALLPQIVADTVGVREEIGRPVLDTLTEALGLQRALLVLDNCEHVVTPAARLAEQLLRRCPDLQVLVTSREPLDVPGEAVFRVRELSLPPLGTGHDLAALLRFDAVRLFVERARAGAPEFALTEQTAAHVAAICARLDGLPLAIELAARRARLLPVAEINARLDDRFRLLRGGPRTVADRHRSLHAAIDWSYDLLEPLERVVLRRLSVLVGGFEIATARAVCADDQVLAAEMLDLLTGLEAKSLIVPSVDGTGGRFRQLESIRLHGRDRLHAAGEEDLVFDRLAEHLLRLAEPAIGDEILHSYEELAPLDAERANLLPVIEWAVRRGDPRQVLLAAALGRCWRYHGYISDGRALLRSALAAAEPSPAGRSAALVQAAGLAVEAGDHAEAMVLATEAVRLEGSTGHPARRFRALDMASRVHLGAGRPDEAYRTSLRALQVLRPLDRPLDTAVGIHNAAYIALQAGHLEQAGELMEECLPLYRRHSPYPLPPEWLHSAGMLALARVDVDTAEHHFREALERYLSLPDTDDLPLIGVTMLDGLALTAALRGEPIRALRLDAAAGVMFRTRHAQRDATLEQQRQAALGAVRDQLGPADVVAAENAGAKLGGAQAVRYAVLDVWPDEPTGPVLVGRERELARLVAAGLTNRQIAARLHVAQRTVEADLKSIRTRHQLRSRAQLAAWSIEHLGGTTNGHDG